jgi:hypothetical protein
MKLLNTKFKIKNKKIFDFNIAKGEGRRPGAALNEAQ